MLAVGRMVPKKGFDILLRALADPILRDRPVVTVLVGEGDEWQSWQRLGRELGIAERLRWVGSVPSDRIGRYYNASDLLAMPSVSRPADGLNVCVLDAMSCGKPVVGSDVAGNPLRDRGWRDGHDRPRRRSVRVGAGDCRSGGRSSDEGTDGAAGRRRIDEELGLAGAGPSLCEALSVADEFGRLSDGPVGGVPERKILRPVLIYVHDEIGEKSREHNLPADEHQQHAERQQRPGADGNALGPEPRQVAEDAHSKNRERGADPSEEMERLPGVLNEKEERQQVGDLR